MERDKRIITLIAIGAILLSFVWVNAQENSDLFVYLPLINNGQPDPTTPVDGLTNEELLETVQTIETIVNGLVLSNAPLENRDLEQEVLTLGEVLVQLPNVYGTVVSTDTLTTQAILTDGTPIHIINNRPHDALPTTTADQAPLPISTHDPATFGGTLPSSDLAVVAHFDGGQTTANDVKQKLQAKGYVISPADASIDDMKNLYKDMAVLYLDTHGALFSIKEIVENNGVKSFNHIGSTYSIQTSSTVALSVIELYRTEIDQGEITLSLVPGSKAKLGITEKFIQKHWTFKDGFAMIHACFAGSTDVRLTLFEFENFLGQNIPVDINISEFDPSPVRTAMINRGASQFVSFDYYTATNFARPSMLYIFDHLLGTTGSQESTLDLPFPLSEVKKGLEHQGLESYSMPVISKFAGKTVNLTFTGQTDIRLAPSIEEIKVQDDENGGKLELTGDFSAQQGKVMIGETEVTILSWTETNIVVLTPANGPGWIGEVVVLSDQNIRSNPVQLREWRGTIDVTYDPQRGSLFSESNLDVVFRGAIQTYKPIITDDSPQTFAPATYFSTDSTGLVKASGEFTEAAVTESWSGNVPMRLLAPIIMDEFENTPLPTAASPETSHSAASTHTHSPQNLENLFGGKIYLRPDTNQVDLCLFVRGFYTLTITPEIGPPIEAGGLMGLPFESADGNVTAEESAEFIRGSLACYTTDLLADITIEGGLYFGEVEEAEFAVQWSTFTTTAQP